MNFERLEKYVRQRKMVTIPEVQQRFGLKYGEARQAFQKLQTEGKIKYVGGIIFEWALVEVGKPRRTKEEIEALRDLYYKDGPLLETWLKELEEEEDDDELAELFDDEEDDTDRKMDVPVSFIPVEKKRELVTLDSITCSDEFCESKGRLSFAVGIDAFGKNVVADLAELPHLLIAGTTGSGKSTVLNSLIVSLAQKYSPDYVKFLLVDTKCVELTRFNGLPHLLTREVVTVPEDVFDALDYLIVEMNRRYDSFRSSNVGNIVEYNGQSATKLPYLVFVVDELADVMGSRKREFEIRLLRLSQKCRASGIHIVLATQRPDVTVVSGTVKASIPARIALRMSSKYDSVNIIGSSGAEELIGQGDMLFMGIGSPNLQRVQGALVTSEEIRAVIGALKRKYSAKSNAEAEDKISLSRKATTTVAPAPPTNSEVDPLCKRALRFWLEKQAGRASIASIQRNLGIGFNRAGRIMDYCQKMGYVETIKETDPSSKPVTVLITLADLDRLFPDQDD